MQAELHPPTDENLDKAWSTHVSKIRLSSHAMELQFSEFMSPLLGATVKFDLVDTRATRLPGESVERELDKFRDSESTSTAVGTANCSGVSTGGKY